MKTTTKQTTKDIASVLADVSIELHAAGLTTTVIATVAGILSLVLGKVFPAVDEKKEDSKKK